MEILIHRDGQDFGPYTLREIHQRLADGSIALNDFAWHEGAPDWAPLQEVLARLPATADASSSASAPPRGEAPELGRVVATGCMVLAGALVFFALIFLAWTLTTWSHLLWSAPSSSS